LSISPGTTYTQLTIDIIGDDEFSGLFALYFDLTLSAVTGATLGGTGGFAFGQIYDDESPPIMIDASYPSVVEGDSGSTAMRFTVFADRPVNGPVTMDADTFDDSAQQGLDYEPLVAAPV